MNKFNLIIHNIQKNNKLNLILYLKYKYNIINYNIINYNLIFDKKKKKMFITILNYLF